MTISIPQFRHLQKNKWALPLWLLILTILTYGILTPKLGFYFDDWPVIYMIQSGANFWDFYQFDRPFSAWTYVLTAPILGTNPFLWHTFTLLLRWLTSLLLWWVLTLIWPERKKEAIWTAMLFTVHPVFLQQSIAVAYSQHFITYAFYFLSIGTMIQAFVNKKHRAWFTTISILSAVLHIFTMEYFWGLELVRPIILWTALSTYSLPGKERVKKTLITWVPFLIILLGAIVWRVAFYGQRFAPGEDPNTLRLLGKLIEAPVQETINLFENTIRDFIYLMVSVWTRTIQPELIEIRKNYIGFSWIVVVLSFFLLWGFQHYFLAAEETDKPQSIGTWNRQAIILGFAIFFFGTLPVWMTDKFVHQGMYADRFALAGMWGASLLVVSLFSLVGIQNKSRSIILVTLISLAIGTHFRTANEYRWDWVKQKRFFWQLFWRAPELEPNTAIFSEGTLFSFVGEYPTAFAINTFYESKSEGTELPFWFIELDSGFHSNPAAYLDGIPLTQSLRDYSFTGNSLDSIVLDYSPENGNCLWVLDEEDQINNELPGLTWEALPLSDLNRIHFNNESASPSWAIFGPEPTRDWCYYYQMADTAHHEENWQEVLDIKNSLDQQDIEPNNKLEWIPFIEAYTHVSQWDEAAELTLEAYERSPITRKTFCELWRLYADIQPREMVEATIIKGAIVSLGCP